MNYSKILAFLFVIGWMILIFMFSNQPADISSDVSGSFAENTINSINKISGKGLSANELERKVESFQVPVRKMGHFLEYLVLGVLVLNLLRMYPLTIKQVLILSIVICVLYASSDEIHQIFISGRAGRITDVLIDALGIITGILIYARILKKRNAFTPK